MKIIRSLLVAVVLGILVTNLLVVPPQVTAREEKPVGSQITFRIVHDNESVPILFDQKDAEVVGVCTKALAKDIELITSTLPQLQTSLKPDIKAVIIIGTLGKSEPVNHLIQTGKISYSGC